ncbi:V-type ATP synthase subunit I [Salinilacihabitans rarus]|uniref:V-type ATP synthase subunit I n=1 Tax=Salinilacihabitans rarus TaxID=2961596 RepID=UPI0020C88955|nr:V-type ATP synthase subunit I [Salinilacihabitans rarus]
MLRPERMSKVSVTGSKAVMADVIGAVHELNRLHLSDYDGTWQGFDNGDPISGAEEASEKLVTVRALESTLDVDDDDVEPDSGRLEDGWEERLEEVRTRVNDLDDERSEVRERLRRVEERIDRVAPFAELGIDLDLLSGYESVDVVVGEGDLAEIEAALEAADEIRAYETFTGDSESDVVAIVAAPADDADVDAGESVVDDALVGIEFASHDIPETDRSPDAYVRELTEERRDLEATLEEVDTEIERIRNDEAGFLLRAEEALTIEVQRAEAPLQFATTPRAFVAEGWIPTAEYDRLVATLSDAVGDSVEVEELERADYDRHGAPTHTEDVQQGGPAAAEDEEADREPQKAATDGGEASGADRSSSEARADGGVVTMDDTPPTVQSNPSPAKPFEVLVKAVSAPKYGELDPTIFLFLTFPAFFGFMIGDVGYGILYVAIGYYMYSRFESTGVTALGGIGMWAGGFTILFGLLYGEIFGLHELGEIVWGGHPPMEKGLSPATVDYAYAWLIASVVVGIVHLNVGYVLDFVENVSHGLTDAIFHSGSWILMINGLWIWIFSAHGESQKPEFLFTAFDGQPYDLGFAGFPEMALVTIPGVGTLTLPLLVFLVGLVMLGISDAPELAEALSVLVNALSYTRMAAVLLAKAGMALVVNLLFFGMYEDPDGEWHFLTDHDPSYVAEHYGDAADLVFPGLMHEGVAGLLGGIVILVLGHLLVLALGVTSAGLQAVRLEYVEFFGKFYDGGGRNYEPFGYDRNHSED